MAMKDPQARTKQIIKDDIETIRAYADAFGVEMPDLDENGEVVGLPAPYPREVAGVVRSGYRIYELGQKAVETGMPCLNPILGRNSAEETWKESNDIYKYAEKFRSDRVPVRPLRGDSPHRPAQGPRAHRAVPR